MAIDFNGKKRIFYGQTELEKVYQGSTLKWRKPIAEPFRVNNLYAGTNTVTLSRVGTVNDISLEYSTDGSTWNTWTETNGVRTMSIPQNGSFYLKGSNPNGLAVDMDNYYNLTCSQDYNVGGNINSLFTLYNTNTVPAYCFTHLFHNSTTLTAASALLLPATNLNNSCYRGLFHKCYNLVSAPTSLPATTIPDYAYREMFSESTSLTSVPDMTIETLTGVRQCSYMFYGTTSLTNASPIKLNATTLYDHSYSEMFRNSTVTTPPTFTSSGINAGSYSMYGMFQSCNSLTTAPAMTIITAAEYSFAYMFYGTTSLTDASPLKLNALTLYARTCFRMFRECTNLLTAPEIMATTLDASSDENASLSQMFLNCSRLNLIKVHFTSWNSGHGTYIWTQGTGSSGTFYKPSALPATKNSSGNTTNAHYIPYNWTVVNY